MCIWYLSLRVMLLRLIHVLHRWVVFYCIDVPQFICSPVDGHFSSFYLFFKFYFLFKLYKIVLVLPNIKRHFSSFSFLPVTIKATINLHIQFFDRNKFLFFLGKWLWVALLGPIVSVSLTLYEHDKLFSRVAVPFYIPNRNIWDL